MLFSSSLKEKVSGVKFDQPQRGETERPAHVLKNRKVPITIGLVFLLALPLYFLSSQSRRPLRFEIGSMDCDYLDEKEQFYSRGRMEGPIRRPDNTVEVIEFYARLTKRRATFKLPYHAFRSPVRIRIRCHRFGLDGTVALIVNGEHLQDFVFTERSYPWGGVQAIIPQEVAQRGALTIELETRDFELSSISCSHVTAGFLIVARWVLFASLWRRSTCSTHPSLFRPRWRYPDSGLCSRLVSRLNVGWRSHLVTV